MDEERRERNRALFLHMMEALGRKDWDAGFACMTDDVHCDWPYLPIPDMPEAIIGSANVRAFFDEGQKPMAGLDYRIDQIYETLDPDVLIAEYRSHSRHLATGVPYGNRYLGILKFRDGRVCYWREYINPLAITRMFEQAAGRS